MSPRWLHIIISCLASTGGGSKSSSKASKVNLSIDFYWIGMQNWKKKMNTQWNMTLLHFMVTDPWHQTVGILKHLILCRASTTIRYFGISTTLWPKDACFPKYIHALHIICQKYSNLAFFCKNWGERLPDRSVLIGQKWVENVKFK